MCARVWWHGRACVKVAECIQNGTVGDRTSLDKACMRVCKRRSSASRCFSDWYKVYLGRQQPTGSDSGYTTLMPMCAHCMRARVRWRMCTPDGKPLHTTLGLGAEPRRAITEAERAAIHSKPQLHD